MRFMLISIISSLIAFLLWPWIKNFFQFLKREYNNVTTFNETEKEKEIKSNDDKT